MALCLRRRLATMTIALTVLGGFYLFYVFIGVQSRKPWPK